MKRIFALTVCFMLLFSCAAHGAEPSLSAESAVLMCADTGDVLFEKNKDLGLAAGKRHENYDDAPRDGGDRKRKP